MKHKKDLSPVVPQRDKISSRLTIRPLNWTPNQKTFLELALDKHNSIIFVNGPAGTAKTLLASYAALELLNDHRVSDILYLRSAVESSDSKLGYLPGEVKDKMAYYGIPFNDKLEELLKYSDINMLAKEDRIDIQPVNFVRGQNWNARAVIIDEAQNMTQKELITVLTRLGKYSKCFVLADPMQSDINGKSGAFAQAFELFQDQDSKDHGVVTFTFTEEDIMRSELVKFLVKKFKHLKAHQ
jgi:phosphate starvation-inducible PhoH-like protein